MLHTMYVHVYAYNMIHKTQLRKILLRDISYIIYLLDFNNE